jgi:Fe-S oxidoreductase
VDPHTTDILKNVYPKLVPGYSLEVKSYLEILREKGVQPKNRLESAVVVHDSCLYARYLDMIEEPRRLLEKAGVTTRDPEFSGKMTFCCGGPVESLFPDKAKKIAVRRIEQLAEAGNDIVTMCPICLHNLEKAAQGNGVSVKDISELLLQAYSG